jgi:hypothetical protein
VVLDLHASDQTAKSSIIEQYICRHLLLPQMSIKCKLMTKTHLTIHPLIFEMDLINLIRYNIQIN